MIIYISIAVLTFLGTIGYILYDIECLDVGDIGVSILIASAWPVALIGACIAGLCWLTEQADWNAIWNKEVFRIKKNEKD